MVGTASATDRQGIDGAGDRAEVAKFLAEAIEAYGDSPGGTERVLDFGCGAGALVQEMQALGFDAYGCDFEVADHDRLARIATNPYRLPYLDATMDVVVSTSVLEHAQNTEKCFREIHRVLRPGGIALHIFPGKWYLPTEPHIRVPLVNWLWPRRPRWWLALWALLGIRNEFQAGLEWPEVVALNDAYIRDGLCYRSTRFLDRASRRVFGDCAWPMRFYIEHSPGGMAQLGRRLPWPAISGLVAREVRMSFLLQRRQPAPFSSGVLPGSAPD